MQTEIMQTGPHEAPPRGKGKLIGVALGGVAVVAGITVWFSAQGRQSAPASQARSPDTTVSTPVAAAPQPAPAPAAPPPSRVTITGLPRGGSVSVDGRAQPGDVFDLVEGQHQILMQAPGYQPATVAITAVPGKAERIAFAGRPAAAQPARAPQRPPQQFPVQQARPSVVAPPTSGAAAKGVLQVRVNPWANISVDGVDFPAKTGVVDTLLPGAHSIRFERDGFVTVDTVVTVRAGDQSRLNIRLTPKGHE